MANAPTKPTSPAKTEKPAASGLFATLTIPILAFVVAIYNIHLSYWVIQATMPTAM